MFGMRKICLYLLLVVGITAGCSNKSESNSSLESAPTMKATIEQAEDSTLSISSMNNISEESEANGQLESVKDTETEAVAEEEIAPSLQELVIGNTYEIPQKCHFSLQRVQRADNIQLSSNSYRGEPDNKNNTYVDMIFSYENLEKAEVPVNSTCRAVLTYGDGYVYKAEYWSANFAIIPLSEDTLHVVFEVPKKLCEDDLPFFVKLTFDPYNSNGYVYSYTIEKASL